MADNLVPKKNNWKNAVGVLPTLLDTAAVLTQNRAISDIEATKNRATVAETPSLHLKVRTPVGMTEQQKVAARNQALSTPVSYKGSDFSKQLVANNMRQKNITDTNNQIAFKDAEMLAADRTAAIGEENANRQVQYGVAADRMNKQMEMQDYWLTNRVNAMQDRRMLLADMFKSLNMTQDSNREFEFKRQQANQDAKLSLVQNRVYDLQDQYDAALASKDSFKTLQAKERLDKAQAELDNVLSNQTPHLRSFTISSLLGFKNGGRVKLIHRT